MEESEVNNMKGAVKIVEFDIGNNKEEKYAVRTISYEGNDALLSEINSIKNIEYSHMVKFIKAMDNMNKSKSTIIFEYCPSKNVN